MRKTIGWLCFVSLIFGLFFAGYYTYIVMTPFFRGAEVRHYERGEGRDNIPQDISQQLAKNGLNESANAILRGYVTGVNPRYVERAWDALSQLVETWSSIETDGKTPITNVEWAAVSDLNGNVVASYPEELSKTMGHVQRHSHSGWYAAQGEGNFSSENFDIYDIEAEDSGAAIGSLAIAWRPYDIVAVIPPSARVNEWIPKAVALWVMFCSMLAFMILLPIWVVMDADWRGMRGGAWGVLVVVTGFFGFAAYLIARLSPPKPCPNCGEMIHTGYKRCPACGVTLLTKCPKCHKKLKPGWQYCPVCNSEQPSQPEEIIQVNQQPESAGAITIVAQPNSDDTLPVASYSSLGVTVIDKSTGAPISGANVIISGPTEIEGLTGNEGYFEAKMLLCGAYSVSALACGYEKEQTQTDVARDEHSTLKLTLKAQPGSISGSVLDRTTMQPVSGANVFIDSSRLDRAILADSSGNFTLENIPPGPYTVCAEAEGYERQTRLAEVEPGKRIAISFEQEKKDAVE